MPKRIKEAARVVQFFRTAPLDVAQHVLDIAQWELRTRQGAAGGPASRVRKPRQSPFAIETAADRADAALRRAAAASPERTP